MKQRIPYFNMEQKQSSQQQGTKRHTALISKPKGESGSGEKWKDTEKLVLKPSNTSPKREPGDTSRR